MQAPCKGCEEREVGCHAGCAKYLEFAAERVIRDKQAREAQEINSETVRRLTKRTRRR